LDRFVENSGMSEKDHVTRILEILNELPFPKQFVVMSLVENAILSDHPAPKTHHEYQEIVEIDFLRKKRHELYLQMVNKESANKCRNQASKIADQIDTIGRKLFRLTGNRVYYPKND